MPRATKANSAQPKVGNKGECPQCHRYFQRDLKRHMDTHRDLSEFPWKCPYDGCEYRGRQKSNLKTHLNVHTRGRPYTCPEHWVDENDKVTQCVACFPDPAQLNRHRNKVHGYVARSKKPLQVLRRSVKEQEQDAKVYALTIELKIGYKQALDMVRAEAAGLPMAVQRAALEASRQLESTTPKPSSACPSPSPSSPTPSLSTSSSSSSSPEPSPPSTPEPDLQFPAEIAAFFDPASLDNSVAGASWDAPAVAGPSTLAFSGDVLPQDSYCGLAYTLPQPPAAQFPGRDAQPQYQNFVDVSAEANMLLPSQVPPQYFGVAPDYSLPVDTWAAQNASFGYLEPAVDMNMMMAMAAGACPGVPNMLSLDHPSGPFQEPLVPLPSIWDTYYFVPAPPSAAPSPQTLNELALDEFLYGSSA
ncbi:hypothetical protein FKP32DRAFT_1681196 [Trametes sanguinea]|nr:hypothetical protein FKP32DRAFT_1681196 [Trametes sanguinea]